MRLRFTAILIIVASLVSLSSYGIATSLASHRASAASIQVHVGRGLVRTPSLGQVLEASMPVTLNWALDNPAEVESEDLILSTDGGLNFNNMIAAHLPPKQQQLIWAATYHNATAKAKLKLSLHLVNGGTDEIISDDFSILPAPHNPAVAAEARKRVMEGSAGTGDVGPAFANPGPCVSATLPTLNYNMTNTAPCFTNYGIEPSTAQDPTNPGHFHTVSGFFADTNTTGGDWQFTGTSVTGPLTFQDKNGVSYSVRGDMTTAVGVDGTVYVVSMGATSFNVSDPVDSIMIFRSKVKHGVSGATFEPVVRIPALPVAAIDKPVVAVHPGNANILTITFLESSGGFGVGTWLAICNAASTDTLGNPSDLSNSSYWSYTKPRKSAFTGDYLDIVNSTHPVIDPISTGSNSYWLFVVQPNTSLTNGTGGAKVYKYQLNNGDPATVLGAPAQTPPLPPGGVAGETSAGYPLWTNNSNGCTAIEETLRVSENCARGRSNLSRAAIDYCDSNAHRMYIPVLANTLGSGLQNPLTSDLFVIVWQYTGSGQSATVARILPVENHKYAPCAATDGHGRVWINCYAVTSAQNSVNHNVDYQTAQMGAFAVDRISGAAGAVAYKSLRLPQSFTPGADINKFGDYVYTEATFYPASGGSRIAMPSLTDLKVNCSGVLRNDFWIGISGWQ